MENHHIVFYVNLFHANIDFKYSVSNLFLQSFFANWKSLFSASPIVISWYWTNFCVRIGISELTMMLFSLKSLLKKEKNFLMGLGWFWMRNLHKNIQLMLEFLKAPFLILHFSDYSLMTSLIMLSVILPLIPLILLSTPSVNRYLICSNT